MADNSVFITGIAEGALTEELEKLPPWATEKTAESIEAILKKSFGVQSKTFAQLLKTATAGGTGLTPDDIKKARTELEKLIKDLAAEDPKRKKRDREVDEEQKKQKKRWKSERDNFDSQLFLNSALIKSGLAIKQAFEDNVKTYDQLNKAGLNVVSGLDSAGNGFKALQQITALTGVRYTELAASMEKYSSAVNSFGVGKFAKTVGIASSGLAQFGYSSKEAADLLGEYLSVQQGIADVSHKTSEETTQDLTKFANNLNKLSLATGMSRAAIMNNLQALAKSTDASVLQGQMGTEAADSTLEFISSIKDQNFGKTLLKMMTDQIKPLNQTFSSFQKIGQGGFAQKLAAFTQSIKGMDPESARQAMKTFEEQNHAQIEYGKQQANFYSQIPELAGDAQKVLETYTGLQQTARETVKLSEEDLAKLKVTNKARADLASAWEKLLSLLQKAFGPTPTILNALTTALKLIIAPLEFIIWGFNKLSDGLSAVLKVFGVTEGIDLTAWLGVAVIGLALYKSLNLFGTALTSITAAMKAKAFGAAGKKGTTHVTESLADRAGGKAGKGGDLIGKIGKGIGDIGKGLGKGVKGFLVGLADGLKALGTPKVLLGVLALTGIAAALWITGKAVSEFTKVSWEDLAKAGVALVGLTLAVAGLGAIMGTGVGAAAILAGAAALVVMGASLWLLGAGIQSIGSGFEMLGKGLESLKNVDGMQILGITAALVGLGVGLTIATPFLLAGSIGLLALGAASLVAGPGIALLGWGLKTLSDISGVQLAGIALGIAGLAASLILATPLMLLAAPGLITFGIAAAVAAVPIALLAWGLKSLMEVSAGSLLSVAGALAVFGVALTLAGPFLIAGSVGLIAIGAAALIATPGLLGVSLAFKLMSESISNLASIGFLGLIGVGVGIASLAVSLAIAVPFMLIASAGLLALGVAALIAAPGIMGLGVGLKLIGEGMQAFAGVGMLDMLGVAAGLTALGIASTFASPLLLIGSIGLLAFGVAALVAGPGIKLLAEGLALLEPLTGANLPKLAEGLDALTAIGKIRLIAFGLAALAAGPGIKSLADGLTPLNDIDGFNLFTVAMGINGLSHVSAIGLLALGMVGKKVGLDIQSLAYGLYSLGLIDGKNLIKVAVGIDVLSNVNALGLLALGMVGKKVGLDIQSLAYGLFSLGLTDGKNLITVAVGIGALADINALGLLAFGIAAAIAAPGIKQLADAFTELENSSGEKLMEIAPGIDALSSISAMGLFAFGAAALIASPGIKQLADAFAVLEESSGEKLIEVASGIDALSSINALGLLAFGMASGIAGAGVEILAKALADLAPSLEVSSNAFISLSAGLDTLSGSLNEFTGLETLKSIVETINSIEIVKALAFGALSKMGVVSLPTPTSTTGVTTPNTPKASELNSPSQVSTAEESKGEQATPKDSTQASGTGIEKTTADTGINTALGYQSSLLEQLLLSTNNLVSVNKDILKYARVQA